jgi:flavin reductase (DIM6/NTAB) family NADH-FMN oxidoreductase RutF
VTDYKLPPDPRATLKVAVQSQPRAEAAPSDSISGALFRKVLGNVPTSVAILTGDDGRGPFGMVVGSLVSISLNPPLVGVFIDNRSTTLPRLLKCQEVCVNVLSDEQAQFCRDFSREKEGRFQCGGWRQDEGAAPRLSEALTWIAGCIERSLVIGDHTLIAIKTRALEENPVCAGSEPLIFFRGGFNAR